MEGFEKPKDKIDEPAEIDDGGELSNSSSSLFGEFRLIRERPEMFFPRGRFNRDFTERQRAKKTEIVRQRGSGSHHLRYKYTDSNADQRSLGDLGAFSRSFRNLYPEEFSLVGFLESCIESRRGQAVGIEFGGIGERFFGGFDDGFFARTYGVSLIDHRNEPNDEPINHNVIIGDMFDDETYKKISDEKVDLIIERMLGGLESVPEDFNFVSKYLSRWYSMLNNEGIMLVQTPVLFNHLLSKWADMIKEKYSEVITFREKIGNIDNVPDECSAFFLQKHKGAPEELPLLDMKMAGRTRVKEFTERYT